jgi:hypothetical protein
MSDSEARPQQYDAAVALSQIPFTGFFLREDAVYSLFCLSQGRKTNEGIATIKIKSI